MYILEIKSILTEYREGLCKKNTMILVFPIPALYYKCVKKTSIHFPVRENCRELKNRKKHILIVTLAGFVRYDCLKGNEL